MAVLVFVPNSTTKKKQVPVNLDLFLPMSFPRVGDVTRCTLWEFGALFY